MVWYKAWLQNLDRVKYTVRNDNKKKKKNIQYVISQGKQSNNLKDCTTNA